MQPLRFFVRGIPAPKGSARAFYKAGMKRAVVIRDNDRTKPWESMIRAEAEAAGCDPLFAGAVEVEVVFYFARPKGHFGAKGLKPKAPKSNTKKPDVDKLARACLDALISSAFVDDAQVTDLIARKRYVEGSAQVGAQIVIRDVEAALEPHARIEPQQIANLFDVELAKEADS